MFHSRHQGWPRVQRLPCGREARCGAGSGPACAWRGLSALPWPGLSALPWPGLSAFPWRGCLPSRGRGCLPSPGLAGAVCLPLAGAVSPPLAGAVCPPLAWPGLIPLPWLGLSPGSWQQQEAAAVGVGLAGGQACRWHQGLGNSTLAELLSTVQTRHLPCLAFSESQGWRPPDSKYSQPDRTNRQSRKSRVCVERPSSSWIPIAGYFCRCLFSSLEIRSSGSIKIFCTSRDSSVQPCKCLIKCGLNQ